MTIAQLEYKKRQYQTLQTSINSIINKQEQLSIYLDSCSSSFNGLFEINNVSVDKNLFVDLKQVNNQDVYTLKNTILSKISYEIRLIEAKIAELEIVESLSF